MSNVPPGLRSETCFNVAQTFPIRHLRKCHDAELFTTTKTANTNIPAIPGHDPIKTCPRHKIHNLREQRPSHVHGQASDRENRAPYREFANLSSNRHQTKSAATHCCTTSIQRTPLA